MTAPARTPSASRLTLRLAPLLLLVALIPAARPPLGATTAVAAAAPNLPFNVPIYLSSFANLPQTTSTALGDLNGDGRLDIVLANGFTPSQIYMSTASGTLSTTATLINPGGSDAARAVVGDVSGDGKPDVVLVGNGQPAQVYLGTGAGSFTAASTSFASADRDTRDAALGDLNGDGRPDIVLANYHTPSQVYLNTGSGFTPTAAPLTGADTGAIAVALGDVDGDGRLDIVLASRDTPSQVYLNKGGGTFQPTASPLAPASSVSADVALGDVDGDGRLDIVLANAGAASRVYLNTGGGSFDATPPPLSSDSHTIAVALGDVDGDGALDIVLAKGGTTSEVLINTGGGSFRATNTNVPLGPSDYETRDVTLADVTGDGKLDVLFAHDAQSFFYAGDGLGGFRATATPLHQGHVDGMDATAADLNGDNRVDIVLANRSGQSQILLGDGSGGFLRSPITPTPGRSYAADVAVGDLNGDGRLDVVLANRDQPSQAFLNDGRGGVSPVPTPIDPDGSRASGVAVGDLDGDGRLDVVLANQDYPSEARLGVGDGRFGAATPLDAASPISSTTSVALGDLDGDGRLDIVLTNDRAPSELFLNTGGGGFAPGRVINASGAYTSTAQAALGDVNGDGRLDILLANSADPSQVFLNAGGGSFTLAPGTLGAAPGQDNGPTTGAALADMNGDGWLDAILSVVGKSQIYLGDGTGAFRATATAVDPQGGWSTDLAVGDLNGDGSPDVALSNLYQPSMAIMNAGHVGFQPAGPTIASGTVGSLRVVPGDIDGNGSLDLVVGDTHGSTNAYRNNGQGGYTLVGPLDQGGKDTEGVALGDLDGDGRLDAVLAKFDAPSLVYLGKGDGTFRAAAAPLNAGKRGSKSVALGDLNGDGQLDIVLGGQTSEVYLNTGGESFGPPRALNADDSFIVSVAVGDLDRDGALDIVLGSVGKTQVYFGDGTGSFTPAAAPVNPEGSSTFGMALGDLNGDGALDIVLANYYGTPSGVYFNDGHGGFGQPPLLLNQSGGYMFDVALGDLNGDGSLDIMLLSEVLTSEIYLNDGTGHFQNSEGSFTGPQGPGKTVALGDLNGDGSLDMVIGTIGSFDTYLNGAGRAGRRPNDPTWVRAARPGRTPAANFLSTPDVLSTPVIAIPYQLIDREGDPVRQVRAEYSLDGGGSWRPAVPADSAAARDLSTSAAGTPHVFPWDTFASGLFGQSDNVVVRVIADQHAGAVTAGVPQLERTATSSTTPPFRVRGTQVRVVDPQQRAMPGAVVFRLRNGLPRAEQLIAPDTGSPGYETDAAGFLRGRGEIAAGDQLIALAPVVPLPGPYADVYSRTVRLFDTNIITSATGIAGNTLTASGVQTLTVSPDRPLALFDLTVSLEWDARYDQTFTTQLTSDLRRASELLFQASQGRAALGVITIFYDKENWDSADIRIYASNRIRPSALIGGIAAVPLTDPDAPSTVAYGPGQLKIGAVWNRFGTPSGSLSEDWPRTLVHELGHYLLFLEDNYIGLDPSTGAITPVTTCPGLMSDPYATFWQFQTSRSWHADPSGPRCANTFSNQATGRSDWQTIERFFPTLKEPQVAADKLPPGPASLPLELTEIAEVAPLSPTLHLDVPIFYTVDRAAQARLLPSATARAYLFHARDGAPAGAYDRLTPLGRANQDQVLARGARIGDRLCLIDSAAARFGCQTVRAGVEQLPVGPEGWRPDVQVTPVTSRTLAISVTGVLTGVTALRAEVYPLDDDPLPLPVDLRLRPGGVYTGTVALVNPLEGAYVHLMSAEPSPRWETVTSFALGGNAGGYTRVGGGYTRVGGGYTRVGGGYTRVGGGYTRVGGGYTRVGGGFTRVGGAPVSSSEGDVLLVGDGLDFAVGQFLLLQTVSNPPPPPTWATVVGSMYRFTTSTSWLTATQALASTQLSFSYLDNDVPAGEEAGVQVYYRAPGATTWQAVVTKLDTTFNTASVRWQGAGSYQLMTSVAVPLSSPGWNLFSYPVAGSQAPGAALASIDGQYRIVYSYVPTDTLSPWRVYAPGAPAWVSDLAQLEFGRGYWIYMDGPADLRLNGQPARQAAGAGAPPATVYGALAQLGGLPPSAGMVVEARVGDALCGSGLTRSVGGQIVFAVKVAAAGPDSLACGAPGRLVRLSVGGRPVGAVMWDNTRAVDLAGQGAYLPLVVR